MHSSFLLDTSQALMSHVCLGLAHGAAGGDTSVAVGVLPDKAPFRVSCPKLCTWAPPGTTGVPHPTPRHSLVYPLGQASSLHRMQCSWWSSGRVEVTIAREPFWEFSEVALVQALCRLRSDV